MTKKFQNEDPSTLNVRKVCTVVQMPGQVPAPLCPVAPDGCHPSCREWRSSCPDNLILMLFCIPCQLFFHDCFTHMWCHVEVHRVSVCVVDVGCTQQPTMGSILPRAIQPWKTGNELSQISLWKPTRPNWFLLKFGGTRVQGYTHHYHCHIGSVYVMWKILLVLLTMSFHGFSWFSVGFHGFSRWFHGFSWFLVGFHGFSRWFHGFSWLLVGSHGFSSKCTPPNCILAQRSSLGPPPGGQHRT